MITESELKKELHYDKSTGVFTWIKSTRGRMAGNIAGHVECDGYRSISINYNRYKAHRLAFLYCHGYMPENDIDHINRDRDDNRISNLREVSRQCNMRNKSVCSKNKSGVTGVRWNKKDKHWVGQITVGGKQIYLGCSKKLIDVVRFRWEAEKQYDFPNCNTTSSALKYIRKHEDE